MSYHPLLGDLTALTEDKIQTRLAKLQRQIAAASRMPNGQQAVGQLVQMMEALHAEWSNRLQTQMWEDRIRTNKQSWSSDDGIEELD